MRENKKIGSISRFNAPKIWSNVSIKSPSNNFNSCPHDVDFCQGDLGNLVKDKKSPEYLQIQHQEDSCRLFLTAIKHSIPFFEKNMTENNDFDVKGSGCKRNFSLSLIAMDSLRQYHFAERLGVDLSKYKDQTAAVIINDKVVFSVVFSKCNFQIFKMETHHVMKGPVTGHQVRLFIHNFTSETLDRSALSKIDEVTSYGRHFGVLELTGEDFMSNIKQPKAVLVFYYSKQCAFCSGISHVFLETAKILTNVTDVKFARVNGDVVLLPWEYTMESYPTILFFPANR